MEMGGNVLWLIAAITFLMWTLIFERFWYFRTEHKAPGQGIDRSLGSAPRAPLLDAHQIRDSRVRATDKIAGICR
jgi:biopolymer transport protein ExbB